MGQGLAGSGHQPRDSWGHQELEEAGGTLAWSPPREQSPCWHLDFRLLEPGTMRGHISAVLSHPGHSPQPSSHL